jgi:hypothetical protein
MNIAYTPPKPMLNDEAVKLLGILRDCGIDNVWQQKETKLLSFYLRNTPDSTNCIKSEIGFKTFLQFLHYTSIVSLHSDFTHGTNIRNWFLRYANSGLIKQALQISARENLNTPVVKITYDEHHIGYAQDHADFERLITLFMLENFPKKPSPSHNFLINRISYYEYFTDKYGETDVLKVLRRSIMRKEAHCLQVLKYNTGSYGNSVNLKTTCWQKYIKMTSYDRIRFLRYYNFKSKNS